MSKTVMRGWFYLFDRSALRREVVASVAEEKARLHLKNGGDIYTLYKEDAYRLAMAAYGIRATLDSGHESGYFSHYHPGGVHPVYVPGHPKAKDTPGHVFFGDRDEKWKTARRASEK
jgi:hypothetical protein